MASPALMEQLYHRFFNILPIRFAQADQDLHLLSPAELHLVRRTERWALVAAVLIELAAYLVIFLPMYEFPAFFESGALSIGGPFTSMTEPLPVTRDAWMLFITLLELYVLLLLNLAAVHGIAVATGYIRQDNKAAHTLDILIRIALERTVTEQRAFGINPFEGMRPGLIYIYLLVNRLKGLIGSALVRAALSNVFGREILRIYLDFSGMPIYMAINLYTTRAILRNARIIIMGQASIEIVRRQLPNLHLTPWERELLYDTLQFIAVSKRDYHVNHFYLTRAFIDQFAISAEPIHPLPGDYLDKLRSARRAVADLCRLAIVIGFLLDGRLSRREYRQLARLRQAGVLDLTPAELKAYCQTFVEGQGLSEVTGRFLVAA
jgi:hypothetical protein